MPSSHCSLSRPKIRIIRSAVNRRVNMHCCYYILFLESIRDYCNWRLLASLKDNNGYYIAEQLRQLRVSQFLGILIHQLFSLFCAGISKCINWCIRGQQLVQQYSVLYFSCSCAATILANFARGLKGIFIVKTVLCCADIIANQFQIRQNNHLVLSYHIFDLLQIRRALYAIALRLHQFDHLLQKFPDI